MAAYTTIDDTEAYFQVKLYTGNAEDDSSTTQDITLDGDTDMQPDLVWIKDRTDANNHQVADAVMGANIQLSPDITNAQRTSSEYLKSFASDGFQLGGDGAVNGINNTYVAWCWKESATAGFDINIHTGSGSSVDISHNLSAVPELIFTKRRNDTQQWFTFTTITGSGKALFLDTNSAISTQASAYDAAPTSSVINYGSDNAVNGSSDTYVAYLWRSVQGFSRFGSYTGNGSADGPFVYTGFRPAFILIKNTSNVHNWTIADNKRIGYNGNNYIVFPDIPNAEYTTGEIDILSNGFKVRSTASGANADEDTMFYAAFAESPFVNSEGVPTNAR